MSAPHDDDDQQRLPYYLCEFLAADALRETEGGPDAQVVVGISLVGEGKNGTSHHFDVALTREDAGHLVYQVLLALGGVGDEFAMAMVGHIYRDGILGGGLRDGPGS